jgi:hypothetical protein
MDLSKSMIRNYINAMWAFRRSPQPFIRARKD